MISQTKIESFIEQSLNTLSGFFISLLLWSYVVGPLYHIKMSMLDNTGIVVIFTAVSIARGYVWRRYFNKRLHQKLERIFKEAA